MNFTKFKQLLLTSHNGGLCFIWWKVANINIQGDKRMSTKSEHFPRHLASSVVSEANKKTLVLSATCSQRHEGRQVLNTRIPVNIDALYKLLFSKSKFMDDFHKMRKSTNIIYGEWITNEEGQLVRTVDTTAKTDLTFGPNTSKVTEKQFMRDCSKPGELYSIDVDVDNAGVPYADSFKVQFHYCLVKTDNDQTLLSVHARINFMKQVLNIIKNFIESNTLSRLDNYFQALLQSLQRELNMIPAQEVEDKILKDPRVHHLEAKVLANEENENTTVENVLRLQSPHMAKGISLLMMCFTCAFCFVYLK